MKTYARISDQTIVELLATDADPTQLFYPSLQWVDVTGQTVEIGWVQSATGFTAPPPPPPVVIQTPTLAQLQAELAALSAQIAALTPPGA